MTSPPLYDLRVLVLEDNYLLADDARRALAEAGARIVGPFRDACEAIASLEDQRPDCAVVDVNLGQGPSFAPARALLSHGVPVIFVTGYDEDMIPADLSHFPRVQKPATDHAIVEAVGWTCRR
jgi:DNA-binding LytR/AlgR family response regulator